LTWLKLRQSSSTALKKAYGRHAGRGRLSFTVEAGEVFGLLRFPTVREDDDGRDTGGLPQARRRHGRVLGLDPVRDHAP